MSDVIDEDEFPSNSKRTKILSADLPSNSVKKKSIDEVAPRRVERVVSGKVRREKKTFTESFKETFLGEDARNVGSYILYDVLIPAAKTTLQEMVSQGIEMFLFGNESGSRRSSTGRRDKNRSIVSYGNYFQNIEKTGSPHRSSSRGRLHAKIDDIVIEDREEAQDVIESMVDLLEKYESVSIADLYELAGLDGGSFTDNKYGWYNLKRAGVVRTRGGYKLELPTPEELD